MQVSLTPNEFVMQEKVTASVNLKLILLKVWIGEHVPARAESSRRHVFFIFLTPFREIFFCVAIVILIKLSIVVLLS